MSTMIAPNGLTTHDLEKRKNYVTATDAPAIMGVSPWKTKYDVWMDKCLPMEPAKPSAAMFWGSLLEDDIVTFTEMQLRGFLNDQSIKATKLGTRRVHANGVMAATLDSLLRDRPEAIEAKTHATVHGNVDLSEWGDEWSDCIPRHYLVQVLAQLACAPDLERVWVVLSVGKAQPIIYCVERANHLPLIAEIETACCDFWDEHVLTNTPPTDSGPSLEEVKRVRVPVDPRSVADLCDEPLERSKALAAEITRLEKQRDEVNASIRASLIGVAQGRSPHGHRVYLNEINAKGYTVAPKTYTRMDIRLVKRPAATAG